MFLYSGHPDIDCLLPKDSGLCLALFPRFFYDWRKNQCVQFNYGGCQGNANRFPNLHSCEKACLGKNSWNSPIAVIFLRFFNLFFSTSFILAFAHPKISCFRSCCGWHTKCWMVKTLFVYLEKVEFTVKLSWLNHHPRFYFLSLYKHILILFYILKFIYSYFWYVNNSFDMSIHSVTLNN